MNGQVSAWMIVLAAACGGSEPVSEAECMAISAMFSEAVAAEHDAYTECTIDADCTLVAIEVECGEHGVLTTCPMPVADSLAADFTASAQAIGDDYCVDGCRSVASCFVRAPLCDSNRCVLGPSP